MVRSESVIPQSVEADAWPPLAVVPAAPKQEELQRRAVPAAAAVDCAQAGPAVVASRVDSEPELGGLRTRSHGRVHIGAARQHHAQHRWRASAVLAHLSEGRLLLQCSESRIEGVERGRRARHDGAGGAHERVRVPANQVAGRAPSGVVLREEELRTRRRHRRTPVRFLLRGPLK